MFGGVRHHINVKLSAMSLSVGCISTNLPVAGLKTTKAMNLYTVPKKKKKIIICTTSNTDFVSIHHSTKATLPPAHYCEVASINHLTAVTCAHTHTDTQTHTHRHSYTQSAAAATFQ